MFIFVHLALSKVHSYRDSSIPELLCKHVDVIVTTYFRVTIQVKFYAAAYRESSIQELMQRKNVLLQPYTT